MSWESGDDKRLIRFNQGPHFVKLRASFRVSDSCRAELDDFPLGSKLELNNDYFALNKSFEVRMIGVRIGVDAQVGITPRGKPHLSFGIQNLSLVLLGAAVMLYLKKPIHVSRKETGGFSLGLPITGFKGQTFALQERAQLDLTLQRTQRGLAVNFHELSPVLRLYHDKPATPVIDNDTLAIAAASGVRLE
ncbi:hypothetical protein N2152v2_010737 [Parachlorella kessleri]